MPVLGIGEMLSLESPDSRHRCGSIVDPWLPAARIGGCLFRVIRSVCTDEDDRPCDSPRSCGHRVAKRGDIWSEA